MRDHDSTGMVYLDFHASTPCDPQVVEAMLPYFSKQYANPSSNLHHPGREAAEAVDRARETIAAALGARPNEIVFTGGATESNNIAILGTAHQGPNTRRRVVTCAAEHKSILEPCKSLRSEGLEISVLPVDAGGSVSIQRVKEALTDTTLLVSIQAANNEIGTLQPISRISRLVRERGALFHCDAAQAVGKIPMDVVALDVDLLSVSAHKLYGPKGIGCLYVRDGVRNFPISPLMFGGGQEFGLRSGTLNVPAIVGFAKAVELATQALDAESARVNELRDYFENRILAALPDTRRNGALANRLPGNSSLTWADVDAEALIANLPELALSTGSACTSGAPEPSHVLLAIGLSREDAFRTIRVGIGRTTHLSELTFAADQIVAAVKRIRNLAPAV